MALPQYVINSPILVAKAATGAGNPMLVADSQNIQLQVGSSGNADLTVKFQGSMSKVCPDFDAAASLTNHWDLLGFADYSSAGVITAGSTGIVFAAADAFKNILVNVDGMMWLNCVVTAYVAGAVTVTGVTFNNQ